MSAILLRLAAPIQVWAPYRRIHAWTGVAQRTAVTLEDLMPTWTGVQGLIGAAMGLPRGGLAPLADIEVIVRADQPGRVRTDFHTTRRRSDAGRLVVQGLIEAHLDDAAFLVGVGADDDLLDDIEAALRRPDYPLALGQRACPPTPPILLGRSDLDVVDAVVGWPRIAPGEDEPCAYRVRPLRRRASGAREKIAGPPHLVEMSADEIRARVSVPR